MPSQETVNHETNVRAGVESWGGGVTAVLRAVLLALRVAFPTITDLHNFSLPTSEFSNAYHLISSQDLSFSGLGRQLRCPGYT